MAEIIGKISHGCIFSACSNDKFGGIPGFSSNRPAKYSPTMIKMPALSNQRASLAVRPSSGAEFFGRRVSLGSQKRRFQSQAVASDAKTTIGIGKALKWWEKDLQPNMKEVTGAEDLVNSLLSAGDKLVVVDFFSPGCGGCKALHPKICQLAEMNPDVQFLQVNYEEHKSMCYSLNVHVLPLFRFYRGAQGRLCSFSCTNATIKKFKDALAKHKPDRCSLGPPKGLEEKELLALASNRDLSFTYTPKPEQPQEEVAPARAPAPVSRSKSEPSLPLPVPLPLPRPLKSASDIKEDNKEKTLVASGR